MEAFFTRVLSAVVIKILTGKDNATPEEVHEVIKQYIGAAVDEGTKEIKEIVGHLPDQIDALEKNALNNLDSMDGKVGNLQEQLTGIPGQIINGVLGPLNDFMKNPLGGLFGQQ